MPKAPRVKRGRPNVYDWERILAKTPRKFIRGKDYNCLGESFRKQVCTAAGALGLKLTIYVRDSYVLVKDREVIE